MTSFFNILFFIHIFGIAGFAYLNYDSKRINNENALKYLYNLLGICKTEDYQHSQKYFENLSYKELYKETFPKFRFLSFFIFVDYILAIIIYSFIRINIHEFIDSLFNFYSISLIVILVVFQNIFYLAYAMPEYKMAEKEINHYRSFFEIALRLFIYCSSYLISVAIVGLLNYYVPTLETEEQIVKIKNSCKILYLHTGLFEQKIYNALEIEPKICGKKFISVSDDTLNKARKGSKIKFTINKGFLGARFIAKEELL